MGVKKVKLKPLMSVEESDKWQGVVLKEEHCKVLFKEDVDVYDAESGKCIAKFRKKIIPGSMVKQAYDNLLPAATRTDSRPTAAGNEGEKNASGYRLRKDGTVSTQVISKTFVNSGVAGYYDRSPRFPYCRLTAFTQHQFKKFVNAYPIVKFVDDQYKKLMPKEYAKQKAIADRTPSDFVIADTSFTTVTVNKNYTTAVHKDSGDFKDGFGNLVALRNGTYEGCHFVVVRWGCGFDLQNGDLLLVDVHQWHGNTPMVKHEPNATRLSLVMYYREHMYKCLAMDKELERAKKRKRGDKLR